MAVCGDEASSSFPYALQGGDAASAAMKFVPKLENLPLTDPAEEPMQQTQSSFENPTGSKTTMMTTKTTVSPTASATPRMSTTTTTLPDSPTWTLGLNANDESLASPGGKVSEKRSEDTCWVCGEKSNTFHYGILSCEGCKSFFARASTNHTSYNCPTKQCVINKETRNRCMYCRWKKCVAVGMSKSASKLGRRSKQLKAQIAKHLPKNAPLSTSSDSGLDSPICSPKDGSSHSLTPKHLSSPISSTYSEFSPSGTLAAKAARPSTEIRSPTGSVFTHSSGPVKADPHSKKSVTEEDDEMSIGTPIKSPMSHHSLQWQDLSSVPLPSPTTAWFNVVEDPQVEKLTADIHQMRSESFIFECAHDPERKNLPALDMQSVRESCHVVVSELTPALMNSMLGCMTDIIRRVVCFSKKLPGFCELSMQDRTSLIKNNMFEMVLIHSSHLVERNGYFVVMGDPHILLPLNLLKMIPFSDTIVPLFQLNNRIQKLDLTARETSLLCAMVILSPDGEDIENWEPISKLQSSVAFALRREIRSSMRLEPDDTFIQILMVLPMLREMNVRHRKLVSSFKVEMPGMFSDLHQEVFE